MGKAELRR